MDVGKVRSKSLLSTLDDGGNQYNCLRIVRSWLGAARRNQRVCRLCGMRASRIEICTDCVDDLPWRLVPWQKRLPHVDRVWVCFDFSYPIRQLIHRAKYGQDIACARLLGELAAARLTTIAQWPQNATLFPVPLARMRMLRRGFNQAMEIALPLARSGRLAIDGRSIGKLPLSKAQSTLDAKHRQANIRNAFVQRSAIDVRTAIIVDDVLTTGATLSAMATTLKAAGAKQVLAWVIAAA
ncbi:MAG: ComF family protein [Proteobacteria bacterium]|nr:MAG: ComF family protein [Pseudomonadota bacterium]